MKIELKAFKYSPSLSEETHAFTADVHVDGKKVAWARNTGQGGCTDYAHYDGCREVLKQAEAYALSLPERRCEELDFSYEMNLENLIDDLVNEKVKQQEVKRIQAGFKKKCQKLILVADAAEYTAYMAGKQSELSYREFKPAKPFAQLTLEERKKVLANVAVKLKATDCILNELPEYK